jgi:hypothetical protein
VKSGPSLCQEKGSCNWPWSECYHIYVSEWELAQSVPICMIVLGFCLKNQLRVKLGETPGMCEQEGITGGSELDEGSTCN